MLTGWRARLNTPRGRLVVLQFFFLAFAWMFGAVVLDRALTAAIRTGEDHARAVARAFAEHTIVTVKLVDLSLDTLARAWEREPATFGNTQRRVQELLGEIRVQIAVADHEGLIRYSAIPIGGKPVNVADLEHIRAHIDGGSNELFIATRPTRGRISGRRALQFTCPIHKDGKVDGVAIVSVDPIFFSRFYESLNLRARDIAIMTRGNGQIITRLPFDEKLLERRLLNPRALAAGGHVPVARAGRRRRAPVRLLSHPAI
jgi:hypothetical protein